MSKFHPELFLILLPKILVMKLQQFTKNSVQRFSKDPVMSFVNKLIHAEKFPGSIHKCPKCGGCFHFHLTVSKQRHPKMAIVQVWCDDCQLKMAIDGIVPPPVWAEEAVQAWIEKSQSPKV